MASVSIEQKKLEQLKKQLFGKQDTTPYKITSTQIKESRASGKASVSTAALESINLKSDLVKIAILSAAALAVQISIFLAQRNGLLKLF